MRGFRRLEAAAVGAVPAEATAVTGDDGTDTLWFLALGTYTVMVDGYATPGLTVEVGEGEVVTGADVAVGP